MAKILIVDDAAFMRMMVKDNLKKAGYSDFLEAGDGEDAVNKYSENRPDLVLLDITMPIKDGIQALQRHQTDQSAGEGHHVLRHGPGGNGCGSDQARRFGFYQ